MPRELTRMSSRVQMRKQPPVADPTPNRMEIRQILPVVTLGLALLTLKNGPKGVSLPLTSAVFVLRLLPWGVAYSVYRFGTSGASGRLDLWFDTSLVASVVWTWTVASVAAHGHGHLEDAAGV
jgi:hypothetical protein